MKRWDGIEEFVQVAATGGFSAAARRLGVSKGHVSQQVSRLEERLNMRLLHRTTRKVSLTEAGETYLAQCRQLIEDMDQAEQLLSRRQRTVSGELRLCAPHLLGEALLVPALADFQRRHPGLRLELDLSSRRVDLIDESYDLAIQLGSRTDTQVVNRSLMRTCFHVVGSPAYLEAFGAPESPQALTRHRCLLFTDHVRVKPWKFADDNGVLKVAVDGYWRSNSGQALRAAAKRGVGLAYLPDYFLREDMAQGVLHKVLAPWCRINREVVAVYQHKRYVAHKVKLLVAHLQSALSAARGD